MIRFLISDRKAVRSILKKTSIIKLSFSTPEEFREELSESLELLRGATILHGYENILLTILPIQEELFLNHSRFFRGKSEKKRVCQ